MPTENASKAAALTVSPSPLEGSPLDKEEWLDWFHSLDETTRQLHRIDIAISGLRAGHRLREVGELYGLTRERIRQLINQRGVTVSQLRSEVQTQTERQNQALENNIYQTSLNHPELEISELASMWETDETTVRKALRHRVAVHAVRVRPTRKSTSDQQLIDGLRRWAAETKNPTGDDYTAWATRHGLPGKQTPMNRFGSWNQALAVAGLPHLAREMKGDRQHHTTEELWAAVLEFFSADLPGYSVDAYEKYAAQRGLASLATIRVRLGKWSSVHAQCRKLMRYAANPDGTWELGEKVLLASPGAQSKAQTTKVDAIDSLRRVAPLISGPVTVASYESARSPEETGAAMIINQWGSWGEALKTAGLWHRMSAKARRSSEP